MKFLSDHYPVRRRRQKRVLNPNWLGITWLEAHSRVDTELYPTDASAARDGLLVQYAHGAVKAEKRGMYPRPMFQVLNDSKRFPNAAQVAPCPDCDNWAYTARCADHPELSLDDFCRPPHMRQGRIETTRRFTDAPPIAPTPGYLTLALDHFADTTVRVDTEAGLTEIRYDTEGGGRDA